MWVILPEVKPTTVMDPHAPEGAKEIVKVVESDSSLELCVTISSFVLCLVLVTGNQAKRLRSEICAKPHCTVLIEAICFSKFYIF